MSYTEEKLSFYKAVREKTARILRALDLIIDEGCPESRACGKGNIQLNWFRRFCRQDIDYFPANDVVQFKESDWAPSWQEQFLQDLLGEDWVQAADLDEELFERICRPCVGNRSYSMMRMYYIDGMSFQEISEVFHVSATRVQQLVYKALRRLRQPDSRFVFCYGEEYTSAIADLHTAQAEYDKAILRRRNHVRNEKVAEMVNGTRTKVEQLRKDTNALNAALDNEELKNQIVTETICAQLENVHLREMSLSVRTYNALHWYCCLHKLPETAACIVSLINNDESVRGFGSKSKQEVVEVLQGFYGRIVEQIMCSSETSIEEK